ncbi:MAG: ion transporter, partial [Flavobacteriales bacterium CG_4_10_14_0_8_um_filter_32_5]
MTLKRKLHIVVFGTDTKLGKRFDVVLLYLILTSVLAVMLESMPELGSNYSTIFLYVELFFTAIFSIEYVLRIWISPKPIKYIFSFWGVVDLI